MEIFYSTLQQMLMMYFLMALGFLLRKKYILPKNSDTTMARLETYIFVPALSLYTQMSKCTVKTFSENWTLILYGAVIVFAAILLSYLLSNLFVKNASSSAELSYQKNIYKYALTFGNYGFVGNFIVLGVWGNDFLYKYSLFNFVVGIACSMWGYYVLIPKEKNASLLKNLKRGLLTPALLGLVGGMLLGLLDLAKYVPDFLVTAFDNAGKCQGPVAMLLAGFVIGGYNFKELITNKKVYLVSLMRLIVIPGIIMFILKLFGTSDEIMTLALIAFAAPLGLNTIVVPAAYGGETKTGASMTMISQTFSVVTIPLMYLLFIVLL